MMPALRTHIQLKLFARALRKRTFLRRTGKVKLREGRKLEEETQEGKRSKKTEMHPLGTDSMGYIYLCTLTV